MADRRAGAVAEVRVEAAADARGRHHDERHRAEGLDVGPSVGGVRHVHDVRSNGRVGGLAGRPRQGETRHVGAEQIMMNGRPVTRPELRAHVMPPPPLYIFCSVRTLEIFY